MGAVTQLRYHAPKFNHGKFNYFLRVRLYPTWFLPFADDVDARRTLDSIRMVGIKTHVNQRRMLAQWLSTRFVVTDTSKTETCQSRSAAANEKKGGILSRLIRQNAFNSLFFRSSGRATWTNEKKDYLHLID